MNKKFFTTIFLFVTICFSCSEKKAEKQQTQFNKEAKKTERKLSKHLFIEGRPTHITNRIKKAKEIEKKLIETSESEIKPFLAAVAPDRRWDPGSTVTVAFNGGTRELQRIIEEIAKEWTKYGNITLDFGYDEKTKKYRSWSESDRSYSADIRVAFYNKGYWSALGIDSIEYCKPNEASINFSGFKEKLPDDYINIILHEFGHALGFQHEHQRPDIKCDEEINWDIAYEILKELWGWDMGEVNYNLKKLPYEESYSLTEYDPDSIMHYVIPVEILKYGEKSKCYTSVWFDHLSEKDKLGMRRAYPFEKELIDIFRENRKKMMMLKKESVLNDD